MNTIIFYRVGKVSLPLYTMLLITYILERILFGIHRLFKNGIQIETDDVAEGLIVLFLGPHYHFRKGYPYETRKQLYKRTKLEVLGLAINIIKLSMLIYLAVKNGAWQVERQIGLVCGGSIIELLGTVRNLVAISISDIPERAYVPPPREQFFIVIKK